MDSHPIGEEASSHHKSIDKDFEIKPDEDEFKTEPKLETDEESLDLDGKTILSSDLCEYVGSRDLLNRHRKAHHSGVTYPCDECDYAPVRPQSLKRHKESVHGGVRYPCDQGYIFFVLLKYDKSNVFNVKWVLETKFYS